MRILCFFIVLLFVAVHGAAGFSRSPRHHIKCGYRGTFCTPGKCPNGNAYLGPCRTGYSCCRWL
uniref:Avian beta-defensin 4 n=1 Tax=Coturnix japonica TaxID=93934 RepID=A0A0U4VGR2_COTJA|nr:avian beta-defensin 4 [Coturnix japonica]BAT57473.1 avian beta-defensin 4 [Coturnix japonica]BAT57492.1 avian beta-defensin 4 [Coturnix japonica]BBP06472.1 avian beta-defensin 4 [Coturnix japonica]BBP06545.1 avian beta-defensin 4 [Coturnix japonica]